MRSDKGGAERVRRSGCVGRIWRTIRLGVLIGLIVLFVPLFVALVGVGFECRVWGGAPTSPDRPAGTAEAPGRTEVPAAIEQVKAGIADYGRDEDRTYLTLPEWYIVYSADELAAWTAERPPSGFPYFRAVGQFWDSYYDVCRVTRPQYAFNGGEHLTLTVIGASFTVENIMRGLYENTIGRVTEWLSDGGQTEEDRYAQTVAREYGTFLHTVPWYEFPFGAKLRGLWTETDLWGPNIVRKWERKLALSAEYGAKGAYGWLIAKATGAVYDADELRIYAWTDGLGEAGLQAEPEVKLVADAGDAGAIVTLPRYEPFTQLVPVLAAQGVRFVDLAGNDEIMITLYAPREWSYDLSDGEPLFEMPVLPDPERKRVAVNVPVQALHQVLGELAGHGVQLEHIYDY